MSTIFYNILNTIVAKINPFPKCCKKYNTHRNKSQEKRGAQRHPPEFKRTALLFLFLLLLPSLYPICLNAFS